MLLGERGALLLERGGAMLLERGGAMLLERGAVLLRGGGVVLLVRGGVVLLAGEEVRDRMLRMSTWLCLTTAVTPDRVTSSMWLRRRNSTRCTGSATAMPERATPSRWSLCGRGRQGRLRWLSLNCPGPDGRQSKALK